MALSGVRISWLTLARNSALADAARSASRLALRSSSSICLRLVMSRNTRAEAVAADARERHGQRHEPLVAGARLDVEHVIEDVGAAHDAVEIIARRAFALGRQQFAERAAGQARSPAVPNNAAARALAPTMRPSASSVTTPSVAASRIDLSSRFSFSAAASARASASRGVAERPFGLGRWSGSAPAPTTRSTAP